MTRIKTAALTALLGLTVVGGAAVFHSVPSAEAQSALKTAEEFATISDETERSTALFTEFNKVVSHPRCMNCHPRDNSPRQGMEMAMHNPPVVRGPAGFGAPGMRCSTCHGTENVSFVGASGGMPGHDPWHLAPMSMGWIGLNPGEICQQLKDKSRNGNRDLAAVHEHMAEDGLVGWAWKPGGDLEPAPGSQEVFGALVQAWIDTGAHCPAS